MVMKLGKIPETVLKRSVLKHITHRRDDVIEKAGIGKNTGIIAIEKEKEIVLSTNPITGTSEQIGIFGVAGVVNNLLIDGADPIGLLVSILLPKEGREDDIKTIMKGLESDCHGLQMEIINGHTAISDAVNQPVVTITGIGKRDKAIVSKERKTVQPGDHIIMTQWSALSGSILLAYEYESALRERFTTHFIEDAKKLENEVIAVEEVKLARKLGITCMHDIKEGGIFGALWEMASREQLGFMVDLKKIPVKQETIEICEYFDINPYRLMSCGSLLLVTSDGLTYTEKLHKKGIKATIIGTVTEGNDRLICNEEEQQYLEPPKGDSYYLVKDRIKEVSERREKICATKF